MLNNVHKNDSDNDMNERNFWLFLVSILHILLLNYSMVVSLIT